MPTPTREQQQLLEILRTAYQAIYAIEDELNLRVSQKDHRPRIDYFFDAPRALTDDTLPPEYRRLRLSVEWLAYDAIAIRYLEHRPLAALKPNDQHRTASIGLIVTDPKLPNTSREASRDDKARLKQAYLQFGVAFVALFKPFADRDHRDKKEEMEEQLGALTELESGMEKLALGEMSKAEVKQMLTAVDDPKIKAELQMLLTGDRHHDSQAMSAAMNAAKRSVMGQNNSLNSVEKAHMEFLTAQLGLYEQGKSMVKELAGQGLNVAGQHFEQVMSQTSDLGIGR